MQIDLKTLSIQPLRQTFDHLARRFGDKPASRYQEGSYDIQAAENLHYRPTWDPDQQLYDTSITQIVLADWYVLKDPRQFYYSTYTLNRARQQETTEANFEFVDSRGMATMLPADLRSLVCALLLPLRHAAYGANLNNTLICGYGYGTVFTQPCMYHAMDNLGIAQYLSRLGLLLGGTEALDAAKHSWQVDSRWQPLRRLVEDSLVVRDPFELFVLQNFVIDGLLYPLVYQRLVDGVLASRGAGAVSMLTQFMADWSVETRKWIDAVLRVTAEESEANRRVLGEWVAQWLPRTVDALRPIAELVLGSDGDEVLHEVAAELAIRQQKSGFAA